MRFECQFLATVSHEIRTPILDEAGKLELEAGKLELEAIRSARSGQN